MRSLASPLELAGKRLRNRIAFLSTISLYGDNGRVSERMLEFYRARAAGGAGMVITEGFAVHPTTAIHPSVVKLYQPDVSEGLSRLADAVEGEDCRLIGQLWHVGRQNLVNPIDASIGASDEPDALSWVVPHVIDREGIAEIIDAYAAGAGTLKDAGFSGVEIHGAHGYLITQFLSPWSNTREDEYGGDLVGRTRFLRELIDAVRRTCGSEFIIGLKMPADEGVAGGIDVEEASKIARLLKDSGQLDYVSFSQGNFSTSLDMHVPDMHFPESPFLHFHMRLKAELVDLPVIALGRIATPEQMERVFSEGIGDIVGLARPLISDPDLPAKLLSGRKTQIRPCIYCNVCWGETALGKPLSCIHNPALTRMPPTGKGGGRRESATKVVVVGTGVAGLEAAWLAAERGHAVTLWGEAEALGGKARLEALLPGRKEVQKVFDYQSDRVREAGVELRLGRAATLRDIQEAAPDSVVFATGSTMRVPPSLEADSEPGIDLRTLVADPDVHAPGGGVAVLYDYDHTAATYAAADFLAKRYSKLILITQRPVLGVGVPVVGNIGIFRRLYSQNAQIEVATLPRHFSGDELVVENVYSNQRTSIGNIDLFAYSTPRRARDELARSAKLAGLKVHMIGDCFAPRHMLAAIHEGHALAYRL